MPQACETPGPGKSHTRECKAHQDAREESRQTAKAEEAKRGFAEDPNSRPLNPSSSSSDPEPKRTKTATGADTENAPDQMDMDSSQRTPATAHPASDENVSNKARVARNVLHIRGQRGSLAERRHGDSLKLRRSTDRRSTRRQSQGWRGTRDQANERCSCTPGSRRRTFSVSKQSCSPVGLDG